MQRPNKYPRLRLHAFHSRNHNHRCIKQPQHTLDFRNEIGMAGRIDEIDDGIANGEGHDSGPDGDAALPLQFEAVCLCITGIDAAQPVDYAGVK